MTVRTHAVRNFIGRALPAARTVRAARIGRAVPAAPAADVVAPKGRSIQAVCALLALASLCVLMPMHAQAIPALVETEALRSDVSAGKLPPIGQRIPATPVLSEYNKDILSAGKQGGTLRMLIASARDVRMLYVFGYARLVTYDRNLKIVPDILESVDVEDGRVFTLKLRKGHRWSDGHPFTTEDFRYFWEDVALNKALSPTGPPIDLLVDGQPPVVEVLDSLTVRYSWPKPNPDFLPRLAGASPLLIYRPAHFLKKYHEKYGARERRDDGRKKRRTWASEHNKVDAMYRFDNPDQPTLQPWMNTVRPPADRFVALRNPYFHRIDQDGHQLPYIDRVEMVIVDDKLIPAKTGTGESDLQARGLRFGDYTFLKRNEARNQFRTLLWRSGKGTQFGLFPNLNVNDPVWRSLLRDVRFRRALSLAIDRSLINQVLYFGLAMEGNNTVLAESPLFKSEYRTAWARYDKKAARALLDELGLKKGVDGIRKLPDGRPLEIIVETAGESTEQIDILELIRETWREVGIKIFVKPTQRDSFRKRVFSGETMMAVWTGLENAIPSEDMSPDDLAPVSQQQLQWPKFGQYYETQGRLGTAPDMPEAAELLKLYAAWRNAANADERTRIWHRMLKIHAEQQFVIGTVSGVPQPVVARTNLMNVPEKGLYNWDPGAYFGIYRIDSLWFK
jgi:peptide/nickel transport system substrate-binding protein